MPRLILAFAFLCSFGAAMAAAPAGPAPLADHHQHVFSPAYVAFQHNKVEVIDAANIIAMLDAAGVQKAVLLSTAYAYGSPTRTVEDEYAKVRTENDWTGAQAARFAQRLVAFCGVNPLKPYALPEIERCAASPQLKHGIKLHFGNSDVQLENPAHMARLQEVFRAANAHGMAIVIHMRASLSKQRPYGAEQARLFLEQLLPAAPEVTVQVAHLASAGPGYDDPPGRAAMAVLADAMARGDARTRRLYIDVASNVVPDTDAQEAAFVVALLRKVGLARVLYGSDAAAGGNLAPREAWAAFRRLPLSEEEFAHIAHNTAPYLR